MKLDIRTHIGQNIVNIPGWRTNRKIVVIESDDWGSIGMPSQEVLMKLIDGGFKIHFSPYNRFDSLESDEDLSQLYEVLLKHRDFNGNHPVITANTVVANPNFERIKASGYQEYFYEPFTETLNRYSSHKNVMSLRQYGIDKKIFFPQFHGREHVNISQWLKLLQEGNEVYLKAFNLGLWGIVPEVSEANKIHIQASLDCHDENEIVNHGQIIKDGLDLFYEIFKFRSRSFIANNFIWDKSLDAILAENGIEYIQGMKYQKLPLLNHRKRKLIFHYTGQKNEYGQIYLIRNCSFEPAENPNIDNISMCLGQIKNAFMWKKPAIISTHRLNFIGTIDKSNRSRNLTMFDQLIGQIIENHQNVEFLTSTELGDIMSNDVYHR
jgi:hypothetical protein